MDGEDDDDIVMLPEGSRRVYGEIAAAAVEGAAAMQASVDLQGATAEHMELTSVRELSLCMSCPLDAQNERRGCRCASSLAADACCRLAQESAATRERQEALLREFEVRLHMSQRGAHARPDDQLTRLHCRPVGERAHLQCRQTTQLFVCSCAPGESP